jgi:hypothetical protein
MERYRSSDWSEPPWRIVAILRRHGRKNYAVACSNTGGSRMRLYRMRRIV